MEYTNNNQQLIDQYLRGKMSAQERQSFEERLAQDAELAGQLEQYKASTELLEHHADEQLRARVGRIHREMKAEAQPTKGASRRNLLLALILLLAALLLIGWWFSRSTSPASPEQLYAQYHQSYPLSFTRRDSGDDSPLLRANQLYKQKAYDQALPLLQAELANDDNPKLRFAVGLCQLETEQIPQALRNFQTLIDSNDPLYQQPARWYAALASLKNNDLSGTTRYLQAIAPSSPFHSQAQELLQQLSR
ncbi:MAG: hypothetical protein AAGG75_15705 [Bacteroidota bacterium]